MQWSQLRKRIENTIAESVRVRIQFGSTSYRHSHDQEGRGWIAIDGHEILNMASLTFEIEHYQREMVEPLGDKERTRELHGKNLFAQWDFNGSLFSYLNLSIDDILRSDNALIRAVGMLDARVGKRRLKKIDVTHEHDLVKRLYYLRCEAEQIADVERAEAHRDLTSMLDRPQSWFQEQRHVAKKIQQQSIDIISRAKKTRKLRGLISQIYHQKISKEELDTATSKEIFAGYEQTANRDLLCKTLLLVESKSKLLKTVGHVRGVIALTLDALQWIRPIEEWIPKSSNPDRQFCSLARHLWAKYDVPVFMDHAWFHGDAVQQGWFKHLGRGGNIRTVDDLLVPLTKKMAHHFLQAPAAYSIEGAFRWGQVHALGGDQRIVDSLIETRLVHDFRDNPFWLTVLRFFIRNPMLDPVHINPIIDYIWNQRYEPRIVFVDQGVAEERGPERPNFSMRGRTVHSLLKAVEVWHQRLGRETRSGHLHWKKSETSDYTFIEGNQKSQNMKIWRIRELLSSKELIAEGRQMRHCVATYANSCHIGICSIWTMDVETEKGIEKLLTIELHHATNKICQVRGKLNRLATVKEKDVIKRWAIQEDIEIAAYIS